MQRVVFRAPFCAGAALVFAAVAVGCNADSTLAPPHPVIAFHDEAPAWEVALESVCEPSVSAVVQSPSAETIAGRQCPGSGQPNGQWGAFKNIALRTGRTTLVGPQSAHLRWENKSVSVNGSNPVIALDGTVYVGTELGTFNAFSADGHLKWTYVFALPYQVTATPAIAGDGTLLIAQENGDLHAINPNGTLKWTFDLTGYGGPSVTPAIARDQTIYVGAQLLYALNPNGTLRWSFDGGSDPNGPPAVAADGTVYFPTKFDDLVAVNPNGTLKWKYDGHQAYPMGSAPAVAKDGTIYVNSHLGELRAIRPDGSLKWLYVTEGIVMDVPSSPAIGADGTIYFGGGGQYHGKGGYFYAVRPDGTLKWQFFSGCDQTSPSIGGDGTIYFGNDCGRTLFALRPDGSKLWSYTWPGVYLRTAPAIGLGNRLYVGLLRYLASGRLAAFGP